MKKQVKKYRYGSSDVGSNYIVNPSTTMAENDIMIAKADAKANANPWIPVTLAAGQVLSGNAGQLLSGIKGQNIGKGEGTKAGTNSGELGGKWLNPGETDSFMNALMMSGMAALGNDGSAPTAEVEGKEVVETPDGQVSQVKGPSHEEGGVDVNLPKGTKVYSKRVQKFGESMAERKMAREKKKANLEKLLAENKDDIAIQNAHKRTIQALEQQEQEDLQLQNIYGMMAAIHEFAFGTGPQGTPKYELGSDGTGEEDNSNFHVGDLIGIGGDIYSAFAPMQNTMNNRASDTPNINAFRDYGKDALDANLSAMEFAAGNKASSVRRIMSQANGSKRAGRNSARGVNTMRALDLATDLGVNEAQQSANDAYVNTMTQLFSYKSQLENQQDSAVMQGEQQRDLADRQDKDNYYTQLSKDIATKGEGIQRIGKDVNDMEENQMMMNIMNNLSKYGLAFDSKGNIIETNSTR